MTETLTHVAVRRLSQGGSHYFNPLKGVSIHLSESGALCIRALHLDVDVTTNDLARINDDGTFHIIGRADNVINSGGLKIIPENIEAIIKESLDCNLAIIGTPDEKLGEKVVLVIEGNEYAKEHIERACEKIVKNKQPKKIVFLKSFPRTDSGKLKRGELKRMLSQ